MSVTGLERKSHLLRFNLVATYTLNPTPRLIHTHQYSIIDILDLGRHDLCSEVSYCDTIVTQASCREREREIKCQLVTDFIK